MYNDLWGVLQPLLFGLIGAEIRFEEIELSIVWLGTCVLMIGLVVSYCLPFLQLLHILDTKYS